MGDRDYRHRESKKPKKTSRSVSLESLVPSADVGIVRKKRARKDQEPTDQSV